MTDIATDILIAITGFIYVWIALLVLILLVLTEAVGLTKGAPKIKGKFWIALFWLPYMVWMLILNIVEGFYYKMKDKSLKTKENE